METQLRVEKFWVARFMPENGSDFFRVFTKWGMLLTSLSRQPPLLHLSWHQNDFRIYFVDTVSWAVRDVTKVAISTAAEYVPTDEEREADEPAAMPHF